MNKRLFDTLLACTCLLLLVLAFFWLNNAVSRFYTSHNDSFRATFFPLLMIVGEMVISILAFRLFRKAFNAIP